MRKCLLTACLLAAGGGAHAQGILVDPMRPADVVERTAATSAGAPTTAGPDVRVILTSPERRLALIDGRVVDSRGTASSLSLHPGIAKKTRKQP